MSHPRKSRYTYSHLRLLQQGSPQSPLRVIALVDYDAFYAQCESVRLGLPPTVPLAVQQWNAIIALNYAAREQGLKRGMSVDEVKRRCPEIVLQHVATWREGSPTWAYRPDVLQRLKTDKAALDPYRLESRRTMALVRELLTTPPPVIERASIDEIFLDLSALVYQEMVSQYPELQKPPTVDLDAHPSLPQLKERFEWHTEHVWESPHAQSDDSTPDWDAVAFNIGSQIIHNLRQEIQRQLKYTCSAGVAPNKMLAKLAAGRNKPDGQTVVLPGSVSIFLSSFRFTKIRGLGRELGRQLVREFETDQVSALLSISLSQLQSVLGLETGRWVYEIIRGVDTSAVASRIQAESMLSVKTFAPKLSPERAMFWLRIFVIDLLGRIHELESEGHKIRPTTLTMCHRIDGRFGPARSKQLTISPGMPISERSLVAAAESLLLKFSKDTSLWPCLSLSLQLSGFQVKPTLNRSISSYFGSPTDTAVGSGSGIYHCPHCNRPVAAEGVLEHLDRHVAIRISMAEQE
ncbi:DNA/RNA polymerase [Aspergillus karnatakaensis]|uniref:DNA/RNA polymerase n=1 Tax=Aspergillus karnatakaensis TaxID=1810916 RepID=UPI003CCD26F7